MSVRQSSHAARRGVAHAFSAVLRRNGSARGFSTTLQRRMQAQITIPPSALPWHVASDVVAAAAESHSALQAALALGRASLSRARATSQTLAQRRRSLTAWYSESLSSRPFATTLATSAALWSAGDLTAQALERHHSSSSSSSSSSRGLNHARLAATTIEGSVVAGGVGYYWYVALDRFCKASLHLTPGTRSFLLAKLFCEFAVWQPLTLLTFWAALGVAERESPSQLHARVVNDFIPTMAVEYALWAPVDALNFLKVPAQYQALVINAVCFLEAILLSHLHATSAH